MVLVEHPTKRIAINCSKGQFDIDEDGRAEVTEEAADFLEQFGWTKVGEKAKKKKKPKDPEPDVTVVSMEPMMLAAEERKRILPAKKKKVTKKAKKKVTRKKIRR